MSSPRREMLPPWTVGRRPSRKQVGDTSDERASLAECDG
jgi:hypothetical protein